MGTPDLEDIHLVLIINGGLLLVSTELQDSGIMRLVFREQGWSDHPHIQTFECSKRRVANLQWLLNAMFDSGSGTIAA